MALKMQIAISVKTMKCMLNFEYVSYRLACLECMLSLTIEEFFWPFSSVLYPDSHIPTCKDTFYHPFGQMSCK